MSKIIPLQQMRKGASGCVKPMGNTIYICVQGVAQPACALVLYCDGKCTSIPMQCTAAGLEAQFCQTQCKIQAFGVSWCNQLVLAGCADMRPMPQNVLDTLCSQAKKCTPAPCNPCQPCPPPCPPCPPCQPDVPMPIANYDCCAKHTETMVNCGCDAPPPRPRPIPIDNCNTERMVNFGCEPNPAMFQACTNNTERLVNYGFNDNQFAPQNAAQCQGFTESMVNSSNQNINNNIADDDFEHCDCQIECTCKVACDCYDSPDVPDVPDMPDVAPIPQTQGRSCNSQPAFSMPKMSFSDYPMGAVSQNSNEETLINLFPRYYPKVDWTVHRLHGQSYYLRSCDGRNKTAVPHQLSDYPPAGLPPQARYMQDKWGRGFWVY